MPNEVVYYAYKSKDGHTYLMHEALTPYLMCGDYLLFSSAEECITYWRNNGLEVDRYA